MLTLFPCAKQVTHLKIPLRGTDPAKIIFKYPIHTDRFTNSYYTMSSKFIPSLFQMEENHKPEIDKFLKSYIPLYKGNELINPRSHCQAGLGQNPKVS